MTPRVPLRWRAPNPPSPFVGRAHDVSRLQALLRGPVAVVWGFSGVGKSALVQAALHAAGADVASRTLWLRADGGVVASLSARLLELGVVADAGVEDVADALEQTGLQVVVDGVERLDDHDDLAALVQLLARHGRAARLVCVCREDPRDPGLATRTLRVDPLDDDALAWLLDEVAPHIPAAARKALIAAARGSPWRLLQLTVDGGLGPAAPEASLLALSPVARGLLSTLALAGAGLSIGLLQQVTRLPDDEALRGLARRGWVERIGDTLHLHHAAIPFVVTTLSADERRRRRARLTDALLASLADADDLVDDGVVQAALTLTRERLDEEGPAATAPLIRRLLLQAGARLRTRGHGAALWSVVVGAGLLAAVDDALVASLAGLAVDVGDAAVVTVGALPPGTDLATRAAVAALRSACGDHDGARALLRGLGDAEAEDDTDDATGARLAGIALALERGDHDIALALVDRLPTALRPAMIALVPSASSSSASPAPSPLAAWPTVPARWQAALRPALGRALLAASRVDDALALAPAGSDASGTAAQRALVVVRARALARADEPDASVPTGLAVDAVRRHEAGLWRLIDDARRGLPDDARARADLGLALDEVRAPPRLLQLAAALREGPLKEPDRRQSPDPDLDALLAALPSSPAAALEQALTRRAAARAGGDRLAALELGFAVADALLRVDGDRSADALALAEALEQEARALGSPRGLDEARLLRAVLSARGGAAAAATLAALAQGGHGQLVRRRARVLLGEDVASPLDQAVLGARGAAGAVVGSAVVSAVVKVAGSRGEREWTVDEGRRRVVVGHDVVIELADKGTLFGLLVALGRRGGAATKEQLQQDVWGERHYHPLRHDNRLKVAVRKLRRLLEDALGDDPLEASDDGYRLRGRVRFVT